MSFVLTDVHRYLSFVCSFIGIIFCFLLIFLIKHRTVNEMKNYSRILLQGCVTDLFYATSTLIAAPIILLDKSVAYLVLNSIFDYHDAAQGLRYAFTLVWVFAFTIIVPCSPIQFVYRYLVFCKKKDVTPLHYVGYLSLPFGITTIYIILVTIGCFPSPDDNRLTNENIGYLFISNGSTKDVTLGLRADAMISPIVLIMVPLLYIVGSMAFGISDPKLSIVLNMGFSWMPMLNCFTTTFFVKPYRIAVEQILCGRCFRVSNKWAGESSTHFVKVLPKKSMMTMVSVVTPGAKRSG